VTTVRTAASPEPETWMLVVLSLAVFGKFIWGCYIGWVLKKRKEKECQ